MKDWPDFDDNGDLPPGIHQATLAEVIEHFGRGTPQRRVMARRLERIYTLAAQTGHLARFIIFGSFVTAKSAPGDVDIFLLMEDTFDVSQLSGELDRMNLEVRDYLWLHPSEITSATTVPA